MPKPEFLESLRTQLEPLGMSAELIPTENRASNYLKINGRHCFAVTLVVSASRKQARFIMSERILSCQHPIILRIGSNVPYDWYVFQRQDITALLKQYDTGRGTRHGQVLPIPCPTETYPDSPFTEFKDRWSIFF